MYIAKKCAGQTARVRGPQTKGEAAPVAPDGALPISGLRPRAEAEFKLHAPATEDKAAAWTASEAVEPGSNCLQPQGVEGKGVRFYDFFNQWLSLSSTATNIQVYCPS